MYPVDFPAGFEDARYRNKGFVNCIGATYYLLGLISEEDLIDLARTIPTYMGMPLMMPDEAVALDLRMIVFGGYQIGKNTKSG
jgi:hypothetical protein